MLGKKKQGCQGKTRMSKEENTHHDIGGEGRGQIMQSFEDHQKDWLLHQMAWEAMEGFE